MAATTASLPSGAISVNSGGALGGQIGGAGWTEAQIAALLSASNVTFNAGSAVAIDTTNGSYAYNDALPMTTQGLAKTGPGTLTLNTANAFSGNTVISGGTLALGNALALQNSTLDTSGAGTFSFGALTAATFGGLINGGSLPLNNTSPAAVALTVGNNGVTTAYSGVLSGSGSLTKIGTGALTLTGANNYSGTTTISSGTLQVGNGGSTGTLGSGNIVDNGTLAYNLNSSTTVSLPSGSGLSGNGNLSVAAGVIQFNGNVSLSGSQSYIQTGGAGLFKGLDMLPASTTLTGSAITLSGDVGTPNAGSSTNTLTVSTSAVNGPINLNIALGGSGIWYAVGSLTANAGTGPINITGMGNSGSWLGTPVTLTGAVNVTGNVNSNATVTVNSTALGSVSGVLSGGMLLAKQGAAALTVSSSNTYTGGTTISSGTLQLSGGNNRLPVAGAITAAGGVLDLGAFSQTTSGAVTFQGGTVQNGTINETGSAYNGQSGTVTANLAGSAGLTKTTTGTLTLGGSNTYGVTTVNAGNMVFTSTAATPAGSQNITINLPGAADIAGAYPTVASWLTSNLINPASTGALALTASSNENINFAGFSGLSLGAAGTQTYSGTITPANNTYFLGGGGGTLVLPGTVVLTDSGSTPQGLVVNGNVTLLGSSTYSGGTTIGNNSGNATLVLANSGGAAIQSSVTIGNAATGGSAWLQMGAANQFGPNSALTFNPGSGVYGFFKLMGFNQTVAGISDTTGRGVIEDTESEAGYAAATLTVSNTANNSFNGYLRNNNGGGSGTLALVVSGSANQTLSARTSHTLALRPSVPGR